MIPNDTIEKLERIASYINRKKDAANGDYDPVYFPEPKHEWLGLPFKFRPPQTIDGWVSEEGFYHWLSEVESVLESSEAREEAISRLGELNDDLIEGYEREIGVLRGALGWDDDDENGEETLPHLNGAANRKLTAAPPSKEPGPRVFQDFE